MYLREMTDRIRWFIKLLISAFFSLTKSEETLLEMLTRAGMEGTNG
jgi:hypothetical protein